MLPTELPAQRTIWRRLIRLVRTEVGGVSLRRVLVMPIILLLPAGNWGRTRALLYRMAGMTVGEGTVLHGSVAFSGADMPLGNIHIGQHCFINSHVYFDAHGKIWLGDNVGVGHHVVFITTNHAIGTPDRRTGAFDVRPIRVESGAWIAAGVTILPGVTIGAGAVVAAGALVTRDVLPNTLVGGVPAQKIRELGA